MEVATLNKYSYLINPLSLNRKNPYEVFYFFLPLFVALPQRYGKQRTVLEFYNVQPGTAAQLKMTRPEKSG